MKILVIASNFRVVAPDCASAPERIASIITDGLVEAGHSVTLAASGDSKTKAKLFFVNKHETISDKKIGVGRHIDYEYMLIREAIDLANKEDFDVIHSHFDTRTAIFAKYAKAPVISTLHSPITDKIRPILNRYRKDQQYVSISDSQRKGASELCYAKTIYHGVDPSDFIYNENPKNYLINVGRIVPEKGADVSIRVAQKTRMELYVIGRIDEEKSGVKPEYVEKFVYPYIDNKQIHLLENVPYDIVKKKLSDAKILAFPISWEEPFGLAMIEAMACGTPVVAYAQGSVPEIVDDGATGFLVNISDRDKRGNWIIKRTGEEGMREAVARINSLDKEEYKKMRQACRNHVEKRFTIDKMVNNYKDLFEKLVKEIEE